jgi:hypothetical protein
VETLAAALRADSSDLDVYARVLTSSLGSALPAGMVSVQRDRSLGDRLAGRPGVVRSVRIDAGDVVLALASGRGSLPVASVARSVRGVVISSKEIPMQEWVGLLAEHLAASATASAAARAALARFLGTS